VNQLLKTHSKEIKELLTAYPPERKQAAVMPLLHLAQKDYGYITGQAMRDIAEICEISVTEVASVVGFYTLYHDQPGGKIRLQVCTDVACKLRGATEYLNGLCAELGIQPGGTTPDGLVTVEEVMCLAACDKAPMFQSQIGDDIEYHENQTPQSTIEWLKTMKASLKLEADHE
jgi:NADH-quinone oxidoreductase subunit E